jgi:hypothetical protein
VHLQDVVIDEQEVEIVHHSGAGEWESSASNQRALSIRRCSECSGLTLATYHWIDGWSDPGDPMDWRVIYPPRRDPDALPARVAERYLAMLKLAHTPDAFAVFAGRLLEAVCADRGIPRDQGRRKNVPLRDRLDQLVSSGAVPEALAEQARLVKDYRNLGSHDNEVEVHADDVPLLRGFVESLLDYLYWGPQKLDQGRKALEEHQERARAR